MVQSISRGDSTRSKWSFGRAGVISVSLLALLGVGGWALTDNLAAVERAYIEKMRTPEPGVLPPGLSEDEKLIYSLTHVNRAAALEAVQKMKASGNPRFIPVLIEMIRAAEVSPFMFGAGAHEHYFAIEALSGRHFEPDARSDLSRTYVEWYPTTDLVPPAGYAKWKGLVLSRLHPMYSELFHNDVPSRIRIEEILPSPRRRFREEGPVEPQSVPASLAGKFLEPHDLVCGVVIDGVAKAYPQRMLEYHPVINDRVGQKQIAVTYCAAAGSPNVFHARCADGSTPRLNSAWLYYENNLLLYDSATRTLWTQFNGEPVHGSLAVSENKLAPIPSTWLSWARWQELHPDTVAAIPDASSSYSYTLGGASGRLYRAEEPYFPIGRRSRELPSRAWVFGVERGGVSKTYPLDVLVSKSVMNDVVAGQPVTLVASNGVHTLLSGSRRRGLAALGAEVRAFEGTGHTLITTPDPDMLLDELGRSWAVTEEALVGPGSERAQRIPGQQAYWHVWHAFHEDAQLYTPTPASVL